LPIGLHTGEVIKEGNDFFDWDQIAGLKEKGAIP